jgi:hypothetical protein
MTYIHPEEECQFGVLEEYNDNHPGIRYLVEFPDGESYVCRYFASYESENSGWTTRAMTSSIKSRWTSSRLFEPETADTKTDSRWITAIGRR